MQPIKYQLDIELIQSIKYRVALNLAKKVHKRQKKWLKHKKGKKPVLSQLFTVRPSYSNPQQKVLAVDLSDYPKLKATHAFIPDADFPRRKYPGILAYTNVKDVQIKTAAKSTLEGFANSLILASERAEQAAIRANPPVYDKAYVERAMYPLTELYADLVDEISQSDDLSWADYPVERRKWRKCKHKFCLDYFAIAPNFKGRKPKRSDAMYCCETCKFAARDTELRFTKTGSYLPTDYYMPRQYDSVNDDIRTHELATKAKTIEAELAKNRPSRPIPSKRVKVPNNVVVFKSLVEAKAAYVPAPNACIIA